MLTNNRRVLVTGGATFLGDNIAAALLAEGAEVTLLIRPDTAERLGPLRRRVRWIETDVWDPASLRGRARGHYCVVNTVGSMTADPAQGLTYHRLNFVSARNVTNMVISDGVPHVVLMSSVRAPWIDRRHIGAKREAEQYMQRVGVDASIIRAPLVYMRGHPRPLFYELVTLFAGIPPLSWTRLGKIAPMAVDILARAVARVALGVKSDRKLYYAPDLRRLNSKEEMRRPIILPKAEANLDVRPRAPLVTDDEAPFGWTPPLDE